MTMTDRTPERDEIELLLPWHAAGTLGPDDARRVNSALTQDAELMRRFDLAREELDETAHLNETLGAPSARALERLFAAIEAESPAPKQAATGGWLSGLLAQFSQRKLAWSAGAAALVILLQGGLITGLVLQDRGGNGVYGTASKNSDAPAAPGAFVLMRFNPGATAADITTFLDANKVSIADGPRGGGLYRLRVAAGPMSKDDLGKTVARLAQETAIVAFVVPTE